MMIIENKHTDNKNQVLYFLDAIGLSIFLAKFVCTYINSLPSVCTGYYVDIQPLRQLIKPENEYHKGR